MLRLRAVLPVCAVVWLLAAAPASATHDPTNCSDVAGTVLLETQAWWNPMPGPASHPGTGKTGHVHLSTCFPLNGMLPDPANPALASPLKLGVRVQLHDHPGKLVTVRWSDGSTIKEQIPEAFTCPTEQCEKTYTLTLDAGSSTGRAGARCASRPTRPTPTGRASTTRPAGASS